LRLVHNNPIDCQILAGWLANSQRKPVTGNVTHGHGHRLANGRSHNYRNARVRRRKSYSGLVIARLNYSLSGSILSHSEMANKLGITHGIYRKHRIWTVFNDKQGLGSGSSIGQNLHAPVISNEQAILAVLLELE
jgi:hypothetical protein